jgi:hypothetical protein
MIRPGNSSTGYTWLRDALIPGENALLDAICIYPWIGLALASTRSTAHIRFPFLWIVGLIAVPALGGRWLERRLSRRLIFRRLALLLLGASLFLLFVGTQSRPGGSVATMRWWGEVLWPWAAATAAGRQDLVVFGWLVACTLLARGVWLAETEVSGDAAFRWFLGGLAAFLLLFVVLTHAPPVAYSSDQRWLGTLLVLYFFLGVGWVALVQRRQVEEQTFRRSSDRVGQVWLILLTAIGGAIALVAVLATVLGLLILHPLEQLAIFLLDGIWQVMVWIADAALFLLHGILSLLSLLPHGSSRPGIGRAGASPPPQSPSEPILPWLAPALAVLIVILGVPAVLCGMVLTLYLAARLVLSGTRTPEGSAGEEESVSPWSWRLFLAQLQGLVRSLAGMWRPWHVRIQIPGPTSPDHGPFPAPGSVRGLYRSMLRLCREQGRRRRRDETPSEFESTLAQIVPPDLARRVTAAYVKVRYGRVSLPADETASLLDRWEGYQRGAANQIPQGPDGSGARDQAEV